jgi:hypothetical protein
MGKMFIKFAPLRRLDGINASSEVSTTAVKKLPDAISISIGRAVP